MKLVFYSVVLNHHQACVADEFYALLGIDYCFVELKDNHDNKGGSEDYSKRPYLLRSWESKVNYQKAMLLAKTADVCVFSGFESLSFQKERLKYNLFSFDMGERWLKRGLINLLSPRIMRLFFEYHIKGWGRKPLYKLCCSAFASLDHYRLHTYQGKCYKWGYFTAVDYNLDVDKLRAESRHMSTISIMWCGRFLDWKHPDLPVFMAANLKGMGYKFVVDFYGCGKEESKTKQLVDQYKLNGYIKFHGAQPNEIIIQGMKDHDIFIMSSDQNEGWGAVANEAMANGCVLVASDAIGSAPYLINDGINGLLFKNCNESSLTNKVEWLIKHPIEMKQIQRNAYLTMRDLWSPRNAAKCLLQLIPDLLAGRGTSIIEGPCSDA